jgi:8-hydroxy-5-deazaflavin:NADPH oxidoreductase
VIKAFNTILATSLLEKGSPRGTSGRIALPVAGDAPHAKATVLQLADELGFDPVDAGNLDDSWRQQTGAPAYCKDLPLAALERALAAAERNRLGEYRAAREAELRAS